MIVKVFNNTSKPESYSFKQNEIVVGRNPKS